VYALLPGSIGPIAWVATNAAASAAALVIMFRHLGRKKDWALPVFCLLTICFTPLFEDIRLGQRGGLIMLLGVGAMVMVLRHPILAGLAGGAATSLKFYPGAMLLGAGPKRNWKFWTSLVGCSFALLAATFFPFGSPLLYVTGVLLPSLRWQSSGPHDCFQNSTQLLFARVVGGEPYSLIDQAGAWRQETFVPWHYPQLATVLTYLTIAAIVVAMLWAVRRSGGAQPYSLALGFSLGTIVPGEVFTYQFLPMLPLLLIVFMKGIELRQIGVIVTLSAALWVLLVSPCALPLPSAWTVAALTIFGVAVWQAPAYRRLDRVRPDPVAAQTIPSSQRASSDMRSGVHTGS
ncbi:MAG TPA: glycosyltransferase 87 family protein, partial [Candidatus Dormibacteraeota bacterium]|nr:glycosyltransferase 87 family protein [Candidatus Dormibacteraeota bacterium]